MTEMTNQSCVGYEYSLIELFVPSFDLFKTFCISEHKTELFIISSIRTVIYSVLIYYYLINYLNKNELDFDIIMKDNILLFLTIIVFINILYTSIVIIKKPLNTNPT